MLAYLCLINNRADDLRLRRIINQPPRGIGGENRRDGISARSAAAENCPLYEVMSHARHYPRLSRPRGKLTAVCAA